MDCQLLPSFHGWRWRLLEDEACMVSNVSPSSKKLRIGSRRWKSVNMVAQFVTLLWQDVPARNAHFLLPHQGNSPLTSLPKNFPQFSKKLFETLCQSWLLDLLKKGKKGENYRNWVQQKEWHAAAAAATANPTTAIEEIAWLLHQEKKSASMSFFSSKEARAKDKSVCVESIEKGNACTFFICFSTLFQRKFCVAILHIYFSCSVL